MTETQELAIEVRRAGDLVGSEPVGLAALAEDALFRGIVEGSIPNDGALPDFVVEPHRAPDARTVTGLTLWRGGAQAGEYGTEVVADQARTLVAALRSAAPESLRERPLDWSLVTREITAPEPRATVTRAPLPFLPRQLSGAPEGSFEVEIDPALLERIRAEVLRAGDLEYAALLCGELLRDPERRAALLRVKGQVPLHAGAGGRSRVHFAIGPDSFLAAAHALRAAGDSVLCGWVHSHPPCEACAVTPACRTSTVFFSEQDVEVQSAAFGGPYMVALVAGKLADQPATRPGFRLYGWQRGVVREREWRATGVEAGEGR